MSRRKLPLVVALASLFPAAAFAVGIESVTLRADDNGQPGETVEVFIPTDLKQHFDIKFDEVAVGNKTYMVEFWAVDTTAGQNIRLYDYTSDSLIANTINASVSLPRPWPVGLYRLDVKIDDEVIGSYEYEVLEPEPEE
jgi:hypothetical protein